MSRLQQPVWLRHDVIAEPLIHQWYAWSYLIPPATAARYLTHAQLTVMESFVESPEVHIAALRDPEMVGGPFIQYGADRVPAIRELVDETKHGRARLLVLSEAIDELERRVAAYPPGQSLDALYEQVPSPLKGFVELVYDARNHASVRYQEGLLYRSQYHDTSGQSVALRVLPDSDQRAFVMSTPRLASEMALLIRKPFADPALDALFRARHVAIEQDELPALAAHLGLDAAQADRLASLFTSQAPRAAQRYEGPGVRVRYMGHACVLIETATTAILVDPLISYEHPEGMARFSLSDLPPVIDYALITHNHQDHVMLETLLQLRHRIGQVVVPAGHRGVLFDPSLRLALRQIGFADVREIDRMEAIEFAGGRITSIPVLGEHGDLDIATKTAYWIEAEGRSVMCAADSNNLDDELYRHIAHVMGPLDVLFIGMECEGAPYTWAYGPLLPGPVPHQQSQGRRLNGSDAARGVGLVERLKPSAVYVYAMGQEPWLNYITSIHYTAESLAMVESDKLVRRCGELGLTSRRLLGRAEFDLSPRMPQGSLAAGPLPVKADAVAWASESAAARAARPAARSAQARVAPLADALPLTAPESAGAETRTPEALNAQALSVLLDDLHRAGIQLEAKGASLRVNAPKGALTPALTDRIRPHKAALLQLLQAGAAARRPAAPTPAPATGAADSITSLADRLPLDARLPQDIAPRSAAPAYPGVARHILLTGATGFVGAFLLHELLRQTDATLHCLVRVDGTATGLDRLRTALQHYGLWQERFASRLHPIAGDLTQPSLGVDADTWAQLADQVDVIYHNGAHVHHMLPYERLRAANVEGTVAVLRLACKGRLKPVHHLSSLSVLPPLGLSGGAVFLESDPLSPDTIPAGGYNRSKWMAEHLVAQARTRGLPVTIHRPGPVSGDSRSGAFNANDFLYRLMQGYLQCGMVPQGEMPMDLLPVDHLARSVIHLSLQPAAIGRTFHLLHPSPASSDMLFDACKAAGYALQRVPYAEWHRELQRIAREEPGHALYPLVALFASRRDGSAGADAATPARGERILPYDTSQAEALLDQAPFSPPPLDADLFGVYLRAMQQAGVIPPAPTSAPADARA